MGVVVALGTYVAIVRIRSKADIARQGSLYIENDYDLESGARSPPGAYDEAPRLNESTMIGSVGSTVTAPPVDIGLFSVEPQKDLTSADSLESVDYCGLDR